MVAAMPMPAFVPGEVGDGASDVVEEKVSEDMILYS